MLNQPLGKIHQFYIVITSVSILSKLVCTNQSKIYQGYQQLGCGSILEDHLLFGQSFNDAIVCSIKFTLVLGLPSGSYAHQYTILSFKFFSSSLKTKPNSHADAALLQLHPPFLSNWDIIQTLQFSQCNLISYIPTINEEKSTKV